MNLGERVKATMAVGETRKVSALARSFRVPRIDIEECVHETSGLDLIVGFRNSVGFGELPKSEWEIERYE